MVLRDCSLDSNPEASFGSATPPDVLRTRARQPTTSTGGSDQLRDEVLCIAGAAAVAAGENLAAGTQALVHHARDVLEHWRQLPRCAGNDRGVIGEDLINAHDSPQRWHGPAA